MSDSITQAFINGKIGIEQALQNVYFMAAKKNDEDLMKWADNELNGYKNEADLPEYRKYAYISDDFYRSDIPRIGMPYNNKKSISSIQDFIQKHFSFVTYIDKNEQRMQHILQLNSGKQIIKEVSNRLLLYLTELECSGKQRTAIVNKEKTESLCNIRNINLIISPQFSDQSTKVGDGNKIFGSPIGNHETK